METKEILKYVAIGVVVVGSAFFAYNAQDKITDQASEIKVLQNQIAVLNDQAAENEVLASKNKALEAAVKNLEGKLDKKTKDAPKKKTKPAVKSKTGKKTSHSHKK